MELTTNHHASSYGIPVFIDEHGETVGYPDGVKGFVEQHRIKHGLRSKTAALRQISRIINISPRTIEGWIQGRTPSPRGLFALMHTTR